MKTTLSIILFLAAVSNAQEANPFVNQPAKETPAEESGEPLIQLAEHIVVPADLLDDWLAEHPLKDDAGPLRAKAQAWIAEGKAKLDYTGLLTGTVGRDCSSESVLEQVYPTEFVKGEPDEWTQPTAFETRNLGYTVEGGASVEQGSMMLRAQMDVVRMLPHRSWSEIAEKTRQPTDVFIPMFRSIHVAQAPVGPPGAPVNPDPFAEPEPKEPVDPHTSIPRFAPGKIYLAARADDELPQPMLGKAPTGDTTGSAPPLPADRPVRLIFFRGAVVGKTTPATEVRGNYHLTAKLISVDQRALSDWLQTQDLLTVPESAWTMAEAWRKAGSASALREVTGNCHTGARGMLENIVEVTYPTEWEPGQRTPGVNGQPAVREHSTPTAFETRNTGASMGAVISDDPKGSLLKFSIENVIHGGNSVYYRILRDGEWKADITFPLFASIRWKSELRVKRDEWMFVGTGAALDAGGRFDPARAVMAFIKVE